MQVEVGAIVEGKVTGLTKFGAFVELPEGKTGMVHISEVASTYVKEITDYLKENQTVKVKVLSIGDDGKISLSIKKAQEPSQQSPRSNYSNNNRSRQSNNNSNVWQGQKNSSNDNPSFEDMMAKFKQVSDEKMTDLKRSSESKNGGFSRRGMSNKK